MIVDEIGGHKIERYSSIDNCPIPRFMNFNRLLMIDAGIGSDVNAIDNHDKKLMLWAKRGEYEKIVKDIQTRNQAMHFILEALNPKHLSYAVLVYSIDGRPVYDYSDEACRAMVKQFAKWGATNGLLNRAVDYVKKNFDDELDLSFPSKFDNPKIKDLFLKRKARVLLILKGITDRATNYLDQINQIDEYLMNLSKPHIYTGSKGVEMSYIKAYEDMSFILSQHTNQHPKQMTVREYFQAWDIVKEQMKPKKR